MVDLRTLEQVGLVPVDECPFAVAVDPARKVAVATGQANATATVIDLCTIHAAAGRRRTGCK